MICILKYSRNLLCNLFIHVTCNMQNTVKMTPLYIYYKVDLGHDSV